MCAPSLFLSARFRGAIHLPRLTHRNNPPPPLPTYTQTPKKQPHPTTQGEIRQLIAVWTVLTIPTRIPRDPRDIPPLPEMPAYAWTVLSLTLAQVRSLVFPGLVSRVLQHCVLLVRHDPANDEGLIYHVLQHCLRLVRPLMPRSGLVYHVVQHYVCICVYVSSSSTHAHSS